MTFSFHRQICVCQSTQKQGWEEEVSNLLMGSTDMSYIKVYFCNFLSFSSRFHNAVWIYMWNIFLYIRKNGRWSIFVGTMSGWRHCNACLTELALLAILTLFCYKATYGLCLLMATYWVLVFVTKKLVGNLQWFRNWFRGSLPVWTVTIIPVDGESSPIHQEHESETWTSRKMGERFQWSRAR